MTCKTCNTDGCPFEAFASIGSDEITSSEMADRYIAAQSECLIRRDAEERVPYAADYLRERDRADRLQAEIDRINSRGAIDDVTSAATRWATSAVKQAISDATATKLGGIAAIEIIKRTP